MDSCVPAGKQRVTGKVAAGSAARVLDTQGGSCVTLRDQDLETAGLLRIALLTWG